MTISERIRKAAFGPMPADFVWLMPNDQEAWAAMHYALATGVDDIWPSRISETEKRMFLLFVAEALK